MDQWRTFINDLGAQNQVFLVGPMLKQHSYKPVGPTVYVDGGSRFRPPAGDGQFPAVSVGDGDSSDGTQLDVALPREKDYSDLAYVLRSLPSTVRHVELLGFLGGRHDHGLINFGEVNQFLKPKSVFTTVRFDDVIVVFGGGSLKLDLKGTFSVATLEEAAIRITGAVKYPLNQPAKISPASSAGLSNEGFGTLVIECNKPCFLFMN